MSWSITAHSCGPAVPCLVSRLGGLLSRLCMQLTSSWCSVWFAACLHSILHTYGYCSCLLAQGW
jgi:hypothetical protein